MYVACNVLSQLQYASILYICLWLNLHWSATHIYIIIIIYNNIKIVVGSMYVASNIIMYHAMYSMCSGFTLIATLVHVYSHFVYRKHANWILM